MSLAFDMLHVINRGWTFFDLDDMNDKKIGKYLERLKIEKERFREYDRNMPSGLKMDKLFEELIEIVDHEIKICEFYFEYNKKRGNCEYFNKWKFFKAEDRPDLHDYNRSSSDDAWILTNGRCLAVIEKKDNKSSIKVSLKMENDSNVFEFYQKYTILITYKNFRKQESADRFAEELKELAVEKLNEHLLCCCPEVGNVMCYLKLLHLDMSIEDENKIVKSNDVLKVD